MSGGFAVVCRKLPCHALDAMCAQDYGALTVSLRLSLKRAATPCCSSARSARTVEWLRRTHGCQILPGRPGCMNAQHDNRTHHPRQEQHHVPFVSLS